VEGRRRADRRFVVPYLIVVVAGLILGLLVGRWWTLPAAAGVGVWIASVTGVVEVPPWFLGAIYAALAACAIAVGVAVRKRTRFHQYR
jgi:hypothetical protein